MSTIQAVPALPKAMPFLLASVTPQLHRLVCPGISFLFLSDALNDGRNMPLFFVPLFNAKDRGYFHVDCVRLSSLY